MEISVPCATVTAAQQLFWIAIITLADGEGIISQNLYFVSMSSKAQECVDFVNFMCVWRVLMATWKERKNG